MESIFKLPARQYATYVASIIYIFTWSLAPSEIALHNQDSFN